MNVFGFSFKFFFNDIKNLEFVRCLSKILKPQKSYFPAITSYHSVNINMKIRRRPNIRISSVQ